MQAISKRPRLRSSLVALLAALSALAAAAPDNARADAPWGASVRFYCTDHQWGGPLRISFYGSTVDEYQFWVSFDGGRSWGNSSSGWMTTSTTLYPHMNASIVLAVGYRRKIGPGPNDWQFSQTEWGGVYQVVYEYPQWRGWGGTCVL